MSSENNALQFDVDRFADVPLREDLNMAEVILSNHDPLPLDLAARLLDRGIDLNALERKYI